MQSGNLMYECRCSCGTVRWVSSTALRRGDTQMCASCAAQTVAHGESRREAVTPEYRAWKEMQARCYNESHPKRHLYGGRGITVADEWRGSDGFRAFLAHVGRRPSSKHSLDRIRVDGNYEPGNVRWATATEQNRNRRNSRIIVIDGEAALLVEWAERTGVHPKQIWGRLLSGWGDREAVLGRAS
jgi:hypothetical protein